MLDIGFPGGTYQRVFYVADIDASSPVMNGDIHINLDNGADFLAVFPLSGNGRARLVGTVLDERGGRLDTLTFDDISANVLARLKIDVERVNWFSTYRVHHRVADHFRSGRAFLLGDAGHIHSPAGGQGMNTGIGDAINLAWKLATVIGNGDTRSRADDVLLDSYEQERIGFARSLVATTDRVFTLATSEHRLAQFWRTQVAPRVVPVITSIPAVRRFNFRVVSQLQLNYRKSALSEGRAGRVRGGDRLPWVKTEGQDNYDALTAITWQVHVYGHAKLELEDWCREQSLPLQVYAWTEQAGAAGLVQDAAYLIRPDTYVAVAEPKGAAAVLKRYVASRQLGLLTSSW